MSCLRSVSLRGRKSIGDSSYRKGTNNFPSVGKSFPSVWRSDLGNQFGHQEVDPLVHALRRAVHGKNLSPTEHVVADVLWPEQDADGVAGVRQRDRHGEGHSPFL